MILISHRGNINGKNLNIENHPSYIDKAIEAGYDVEIDVWYLEGRLFLGHDSAQYIVDIHWLENRSPSLWIHCKNIKALETLKELDSMGRHINYFWHEEDDFTLTSKNFIWTYPGQRVCNKSVLVVDDARKYSRQICFGLCSDYLK